MLSSEPAQYFVDFCDAGEGTAVAVPSLSNGVGIRPDEAICPRSIFLQRLTAVAAQRELPGSLARFGRLRPKASRLRKSRPLRPRFAPRRPLNGGAEARCWQQTIRTLSNAAVSPEPSILPPIRWPGSGQRAFLGLDDELRHVRAIDLRKLGRVGERNRRSTVVLEHGPPCCRQGRSFAQGPRP